MKIKKAIKLLLTAALDDVVNGKLLRAAIQTEDQERIFVYDYNGARIEIDFNSYDTCKEGVIFFNTPDN